MNRSPYRTLIILLMTAALAACSLTPAQQGDPPLTEGDLPWWNQAVFYQIFVRSYADSDGDGIGDFKGLTARLDYLNDGDPNTTSDLGVRGIWLLPIHPAGSYHGYDVKDYTQVSPDYGTLEDFKTFLKEAHRRGIKVVIDLVINHTSDQHPWFVQAQNPASPYRDWYVWSDEQANEQSWHPGRSGYYYGFFWSGMPDLNYRNPDVGAEMLKVVDFWVKDVGIDGFRVDAAKYLIEDGTIIQNTDETFEWFRRFRKAYKAANPQAMTVAEIWDSPALAAKYAQGDQFDLVFDFGLAQAMILAARTGRAEEVYQAASVSEKAFLPGQFATFITNHDQNRVMSQLMADENRARSAAMTLLTLPGVPFIYYGEEIGMTGIKPDEQLRTPMQWSGEANAGFTSGTPWQPVNTDYADGRNVLAQQGDPASLLSTYKQLIQLRNRHPALQTGDLIPLKASAPGLVAFLRALPDETVLVLINMSRQPVDGYTLALEAGPLSGAYSLELLAGAGQAVDLQASTGGGLENFAPGVTLPPNQMAIFQLKTK
jgi:glycosidase